MVVRNFDLVGMAILPTKTHPILLVDSEAVLTVSIAGEPLETIAWWHDELAEMSHAIELSDLAARHSP